MRAKRKRRSRRKSQRRKRRSNLQRNNWARRSRRSLKMRNLRSLWVILVSLRANQRRRRRLASQQPPLLSQRKSMRRRERQTAKRRRRRRPRQLQLQPRKMARLRNKLNWPRSRDSKHLLRHYAKDKEQRLRKLRSIHQLPCRKPPTVRKRPRSKVTLAGEESIIDNLSKSFMARV